MTDSTRKTAPIVGASRTPGLALRERLSGRTLDLLFVSAAITKGDISIGEVASQIFVEVTVTNALSPVRVVEAFRSLVATTGPIGVMSSSQGSGERTGRAALRRPEHTGETGGHDRASPW